MDFYHIAYNAAQTVPLEPTFFQKVVGTLFFLVFAVIGLISQTDPAFAWGIGTGIFLVAYAYLAVCLSILARKSGTNHGWLAWFPLLNLFLMCKIAKKSGFLAFTLFIPIINFFTSWKIWAGIAKSVGRSGFWGAIAVIPPFFLFVPGILALVGKDQKPPIASNKEKAERGTNGDSNLPVDRQAKELVSFCSQCGARLTPDADFCPNCGAKKNKDQTQKKFCANCGSEIKASDNFCPNCGAKS